MTTPDVTQILVAVARVEGRLDALASADSRMSQRLDSHAKRLDKLERLAWMALGAAVVSGAPELIALFS